MSLLRTCRDDKLTNILRETFRANIIRIPDETIVPLCAIAKRDDNARFLGSIDDLVIGQIDQKQKAENIVASDKPDISGKYSKSVNFDIGMQILDGFLKGFNIPSVGIEQQLSGATTISFSFKSVRKLYITPALIGRMLSGLTVDKSNKVNTIFFDKDPYNLLIVDSVIQSKDFSIKLGHENDFNLSANLPEIQRIVLNANPKVNVKPASDYEIVFTGEKPLTFAFTCFDLELKKNGAISAITPDSSNKIAFSCENSSSADYDKVLLYTKPGLIDWDGETEVTNV